MSNWQLLTLILLIPALLLVTEVVRGRLSGRGQRPGSRQDSAATREALAADSEEVAPRSLRSRLLALEEEFESIGRRLTAIEESHKNAVLRLGARIRRAEGAGGEEDSAAEEDLPQLPFPAAPASGSTGRHHLAPPNGRRPLVARRQ